MPIGDGFMDTTSEPSWPRLSDAWILAQRPAKPRNDPWKPGGWLVEKEPLPNGCVVDVGTVFLTNRECPFHCLMCDLWRYTTDHRVPDGAIPRQISEGLRHLGPVKHLKLYNAGNFFDAQAIPPKELPVIAELLADFDRVIVECHPRLVGSRCLDFSRRLHGRLEIAVGLETTHPEILQCLNKRMTLDDFRRAADLLKRHDCGLRVFVLSSLPFLTPEQSICWAIKSIKFAFDCGADIVSVIPTRVGNGAMDRLQAEGRFSLPTLDDLEGIFETALLTRRGTVLLDLWDASTLAHCSQCGPARLRRLERMNLSQTVEPPVICECGDHD